MFVITIKSIIESFAPIFSISENNINDFKNDFLFLMANRILNNFIVL